MAEPAAAAAPATPVKTAAPPPTPSGKTPQAFDVRLALAKSIGTPGTPNAPVTTAAGGNIDADPAEESTETADAAEGGEAAEGNAEAGAEGEAEGDEAEETPAGEARTPEDQLAAVTKAFESGDIEAMAKALEKPGVKIAGPVKRAFRAFQRRVQKLDSREQALNDRDRSFEDARGKAQQQIAADSRRVSEAERELTRRYGTAYAMEQAWENQDMLALGKTLEKACKGATLAAITQALASGKQGKTADEQRLSERERALQEREAAAQRKGQEAEESKRLQASREAAVGRIGEALKSHPYLQGTDKDGKAALDQEALTEVFNAYEASWNGEKFTKTARQCADELQEKLVARAKARGLAPVPPPANGSNGKKPPAPPPRRTPPPRSKEPPRSNASKGGPLDLEATRANRIALAKRTTEMQRRGVR